MLKEKEDLRVELLLQGLEQQNYAEIDRAWMTTAAGLPVAPESGKAIGGAVFDVKLDAYYDVVDRLRPYSKATRPAPTAKQEEISPASADQAREEAIKAYKEMIASGQI